MFGFKVDNPPIIIIGIWILDWIFVYWLEVFDDYVAPDLTAVFLSMWLASLLVPSFRSYKEK